MYSSYNLLWINVLQAYHDKIFYLHKMHIVTVLQVISQIAKLHFFVVAKTNRIATYGCSFGYYKIDRSTWVKKYEQLWNMDEINSSV